VAVAEEHDEPRDQHGRPVLAIVVRALPRREATYGDVILV